MSKVHLLLWAPFLFLVVCGASFALEVQTIDISVLENGDALINVHHTFAALERVSIGSAKALGKLKPEEEIEKALQKSMSKNTTVESFSFPTTKIRLKGFAKVKNGVASVPALDLTAGYQSVKQWVESSLLSYLVSVDPIPKETTIIFLEDGYHQSFQNTGRIPAIQHAIAKDQRLAGVQKKAEEMIRKTGSIFGARTVDTGYAVNLYRPNSPEWSRFHGGASWDEVENILYVPLNETLWNETGGIPFETEYYLAHEVAHYIVNGHDQETLTSYKKVPIWYREGMAELGAINWVNQEYYRGFIEEIATYWEFEYLVEEEGMYPEWYLENAMDRSGERINQDEYPAVGLFLEYLYEKHGGKDTVVGVFGDLANGGDGGETLKKRAGKEFGALEEDWVTYLAEYSDSYRIQKEASTGSNVKGAFHSLYRAFKFW